MVGVSLPLFLLAYLVHRWNKKIVAEKVEAYMELYERVQEERKKSEET